MAGESKLEKYFRKEARKLGAEVRKVKWIEHNGAPDRLLLFYGIFFIEFKDAGKPLRTNQAREHGKLNEHGVIVLTIDTKEKADLILMAMKQHAETQGLTT